MPKSKPEPRAGDQDHAPAFSIRVPGHNLQQGHAFLASVHGGSLLGAGRASGVDFTKLRNSYEAHAHELQRLVDEMRAAGISEIDVSKRVVRERTAFARSTRLRQGPGSTVILEARDWAKYGVGGRTYSNLSRRADEAISLGRDYTRNVSRETLLIKSSMLPQELIKPQFLDAARYLKYGGPIMLVLGAGLSAHEISAAPSQDRSRVAAEEVGGFVGGELAAEGAAIALLTFGTGGLGLVAIAGVAVVGVAGGALGSWAADKIYYAHRSNVVHQAQSTGQVSAWSIRHFLP